MIYRANKDSQLSIFELLGKHTGEQASSHSFGFEGNDENVILPSTPSNQDAALPTTDNTSLINVGIHHSLHFTSLSGNLSGALSITDNRTLSATVGTAADPGTSQNEVESSHISEMTRVTKSVVLDNGHDTSVTTVTILKETSSDSSALNNQTSANESSTAPQNDVPENSHPISALALDTTTEVITFGSAFVSPNAGAVGPAGGFTPSQILAAYGINQVFFSGMAGNGAGQTIAIVDAYHAPTIASDLHAFDLKFGLSDPNLTVVSQTGSRTALPSVDPSHGWGLEASLDVQWAHAIAPGANIVLVEANSASYGDMLSAVKYASSISNVSVVSMSWGGPQSPFAPAYDSIFTTPTGHSGVTYFASSGDSGAPGGFPASSPNVVSVGGTTLSMNGNNYVSESAWSGSGGGISTYEPEPDYQRGVQNTGYRTMPDVAFNADPNSGYSVYDSAYGWVRVGGTSAAAPSWAGLAAIINQGRTLSGQAVYDGGSFLSALYKLPSADFHDVITGNNGLAATVGYDMVTGRGTPIANLLISDLVGSGQTKAINHAPINLVDTDTSVNAVAKNAAVGTTVGITAHATDPDGDKLTYSLTDNAGGKFAINASTGVVTVAGTLDTLSHNITVKAADTGGLSISQTFNIAAPINHAPINLVDIDFSKSPVARNAAIGTTVGITAQATDPDGDKLTYSLTDNAGGKFAINATTGVVTVASTLDNLSHNITVKATDTGGLSTSQTFSIAAALNRAPVNLVDIDPANYAISRNAAIGTAVGITAHATDPDGDKITYGLVDSSDGKFAINANTGVVTVAGALDILNHYIVVKATDSSGLITSEKFAIITAPNHAPTNLVDIDPANYAVAKNAAIGSEVGITAHATDPDGDKLTYSLIDNAAGRFAINATTGTVTVAGTLDGLSHTITVRATDNGGLGTNQTFGIMAAGSSTSSSAFTLTGSNANDIFQVYGGTGTLTGGLEADLFRIPLNNSTVNVTITDFTKGADHIVLPGLHYSDLTFANTSLNGHTGTMITDHALSAALTGHLFLSGINASTLTSSDFMFA